MHVVFCNLSQIDVKKNVAPFSGDDNFLNYCVKYYLLNHRSPNHRCLAIFGPSQFTRGWLDLTWLEMPKWAVCNTTKSSLWPEAGCVQLQLSSALGVLYLRLLGNPVEFLPSFHLVWTLECIIYKINPNTFIEPKYGKFFLNNIVCVGLNVQA